MNEKYSTSSHKQNEYLLGGLLPLGCKREEARELGACQQLLAGGFLPIPDIRDLRFLAKVSPEAAMCRGGEEAVKFRATPWADWSQYWGTGDLTSVPKEYLSESGPKFRGISGALLDLEYQRIELIKFNLFDNAGAYRTYVAGNNGTDGRAVKVWPEMKLPVSHPNYSAVGGAGIEECKGELIRGRTTTGICNDILNPLMGSTGMPFARNVEFETTFPDLGRNQLTSNGTAIGWDC